MGKLITEVFEKVKVIKEQAENGNKNYFISGIFMQAEQANKNERIYPISILQREVKRYNDEYIQRKRALGELGHPEGPIINLERVSHIITELYQDGNNFIGKAKILDTPYGKIVKNLIDEGISLGVSSRGVGSLMQKGNLNEVQDDFYLASAADIVADPSAPAAFVQGIHEGKEWILENGVLKAKEIERFKNELRNKGLQNAENLAVRLFEDFMKKISK